LKTSTKFKAGCGILTVFIGGFVLGVIAILVLIGAIIPLAEDWKSEKSKAFIADHFANQLKLTPEQDAEFRPLVYEALDHRWLLRREYLVESRQMMEEDYFERAKEILTEEQLVKAQKMLAKWRKDQERFKLDSWESENEPGTAVTEEKDNPEAATPASEERVREEASPE